MLIVTKKNNNLRKKSGCLYNAIIKTQDNLAMNITKINTWVMVNNWNILDRYDSSEFLDKMEQAGVKHVAFGGRLPIKPSSQNYENSLVKRENPSPEIFSLKNKVKKLFSHLKNHGIKIYLYGTNPRSSEMQLNSMTQKHYLDIDLAIKPSEGYWAICSNTPEFIPYYLASIQDAIENFPEVSGFLNDGPEFGYEIKPGFMGNMNNLFTCFGSCCEKKTKELGYDFNSLKQTAAQLRRKLMSLKEAPLNNLFDREIEGVEFLSLAIKEPKVNEWFNFKKDSVAKYIKELNQGIKTINHSLELGVGSRLPAFAPLAGYDLQNLNQHADFFLPKLYFWMGGYDGLYGTVYRWAKTLKDWNPNLSEKIILQFLYKLFGFALPNINSFKNMEKHIDPLFLNNNNITWLGEAFPKEFFKKVVTSEVKKMLQQVGNSKHVRPWFNPVHGGRSLTPQELDLALEAAKKAGLKTYLYYCSLGSNKFTTTDGEWEVALKHSNKPAK